MNLRKSFRTGVTGAAAIALFAGLTTASYAQPTTFNVNATITAYCTTGTPPSDLTPLYDPSSDTSTGASTSLVTTCNGTNPTVTFGDSYSSGTNVFRMTGTASDVLYFQLSLNSSCNGTVSDNPITENSPVTLTAGASVTTNICAAILTGQQTATADTYGDTVTYTITP